MKKVWYGVFFVSFACGVNEEVKTTSLAGQWEIVWSLDDMIASGKISFESNGDAKIIIAEITDDLLTSGSYQANYKWHIQEQVLTLQRTDNNFKLHYDIVSQNNDALIMNYANEICVSLSRIR
ncbi:MAG: hypothetical protein AAGG59_11610 [Bacteroidota bacterium]